MTKDNLQRFVFEDLGIRGQVLRLDQSFKTVLEKHSYPAQVRKLLGEILAASVMLSATIKLSGSVTLQIQGDGPVNLLLAQCDNKQQFRGLAKWQGKVLAGPLKKSLGNGKLVITLAAKELGKNYLIKQGQHKKLRYYQKQLEELGYDVVILEKEQKEALV